jgi:hypothetical protein
MQARSKKREARRSLLRKDGWILFSNSRFWHVFSYCLVEIAFLVFSHLSFCLDTKRNKKIKENRSGTVPKAENTFVRFSARTVITVEN